MLFAVHRNRLDSRTREFDLLKVVQLKDEQEKAVLKAKLLELNAANNSEKVQLESQMKNVSLVVVFRNPVLLLQVSCWPVSYLYLSQYNPLLLCVHDISMFIGYSWTSGSAGSAEDENIYATKSS